jgi:hypothetical protein
MVVFTYTPIDLGGPAFRLARLRRGSSLDIHCELFEAWLYQDTYIIPYEALSYTWGDTKRTARITLNGRSLLVTENLYTALLHLRSSSEDRIMWIDAICIDQDNWEERGHQVQLMGDIYQQAERVVVWLGRGTEATDIAMHCMQQQHENTRPVVRHTLTVAHTSREIRQRKGLELL